MPDAVITGRLATEPESRSDRGPATALVVENFPTKDRTTGEWKDNPSWWDVVAWRDVKPLLLGLHKGQDVILSGRLKTEDFEQDGKRRRATKFEVKKVALLLKGQPRQTGQGDFGGRGPIQEPQQPYQPQQPPVGYPTQPQQPTYAQPPQPVPADDDIPF